MQANPQVAVAHVGWPWATPVVQAWPQPPQLFGSELVSVQVEPHALVPDPHVEAHWKVLPDGTHMGVEPEHTVPHAPQLPGCIKLASQPSVGSPLQSAYPGAHAEDEREHFPPRHATDPLTLGKLVQSLEQVPHRAGVPRSSVQPRPVAWQSPKPEAH